MVSGSFYLYALNKVLNLTRAQDDHAIANEVCVNELSSKIGLNENDTANRRMFVGRICQKALQVGR